jgi:hypothetical protein
MQDDHPLWYDYTERDRAPARALILLAGLFAVTVDVTAVACRIYWLPDRIWCRAARITARRRAAK